VSVRAVAYIKALVVCPNGEHVTRTEKLVGLILGDNHQDRAHRRTYPSVEGMAEDAMLSERQFQRLLDSLERKGVIRREYPDGRGRGKTTFYFFPELDEKGCQNVTLSAVNQPAEKVTLFEQKGDRRVTFPEVPILSNKSNKDNKSKDTPLPPASGGSEVFTLHPLLLNDAADGVMRACGWTDRRVRHAVYAQLKLALSLGEPLAQLAARMITAWTDHLDASADGLLRGLPYGPKKFIGHGKWNDPESWHWDREKLERRSAAMVGMYQPERLEKGRA
jgi:hypothetical protein